MEKEWISLFKTYVTQISVLLNVNFNLFADCSFILAISIVVGAISISLLEKNMRPELYNSS